MFLEVYAYTARDHLSLACRKRGQGIYSNFLRFLILIKKKITDTFLNACLRISWVFKYLAHATKFF